MAAITAPLIHVSEKNLRMSPEEYAKRLWDWTPLNSCFPRGVRLTDVDGAVEIGGEFLEIEGKPDGAELPKGQAYYLFRKVAKGIRVVILHGDPPASVVGWAVLVNRKRSHWPNSYGKQAWHSREYRGDYSAFARFVKRWAVFAEGRA